LGGAGPILLVTKDSIPAATLSELRRLTVKRIVVLGGRGRRLRCGRRGVERGGVLGDVSSGGA